MKGVGGTGWDYSMLEICSRISCQSVKTYRGAGPCGFSPLVPKRYSCQDAAWYPWMSPQVRIPVAKNRIALHVAHSFLWSLA